MIPAVCGAFTRKNDNVLFLWKDKLDKINSKLSEVEWSKFMYSPVKRVDFILIFHYHFGRILLVVGNWPMYFDNEKWLRWPKLPMTNVCDEMTCLASSPKGPIRSPSRVTWGKGTEVSDGRLTIEPRKYDGMRASHFIKLSKHSFRSTRCIAFLQCSKAGIHLSCFLVVFFSSCSRFGSQTLVPLFGDGELDTLVARQRNVRFAAFANDENVVQPRIEASS